MKFKYYFISLILLTLGSGALLAALEPAPATYVEDRAGVMDENIRHQLIGLLQELEQKTTARVVVLTVDTTGGIPIQQYSFERADKWKFGANQKGASVLVVAAVKDREYFIQVGYNWEGVLPDSAAGTIGRQYFVPYFKSGQYGQGILNGVSAIAQTIAKDKDVTLSGMPKLQTSQSLPTGSMISPCCAILGFIFIIWLIARLARQNPGVLFLWLLTEILFSSGRRGGSWGSSSGGFGNFGSSGGGGFGSFGGGGGGGFGGGGAGGKW